ncbi:MAG: hypothetical protein WBC55_07405 [Dehalococcoidia bacterium]
MDGESGEGAAANPIDAQSVEDILSSSMKELEEHSKAAYDLLVKRAREGFFEEHQTPTSVKKHATELLKSLNEPEGGDED